MKKLKITLIIAAICTTIYAQDVPGIPLIGEEAPKFKSESTNGVINFPKDFGTNWKLLVSHPQDFTPVCSSELLELASMQEEFEALNVDIILVSTDALYQHFNWKERIEQGTAKRELCKFSCDVDSYFADYLNPKIKYELRKWIPDGYPYCEHVWELK